MNANPNAEQIVDIQIAYKARGWRAIAPRPTTAAGRAGPAVLLIGNSKDGFRKLLTLRGVGRFDAAQDLANRYNSAPEALSLGQVEAESRPAYPDTQSKDGSGA